jgi:hypothetical protein
MILHGATIPYAGRDWAHRAELLDVDGRTEYGEFVVDVECGTRCLGGTSLSIDTHEILYLR